jgi:uncharacterized protein (TIGR03089 family)
MRERRMEASIGTGVLPLGSDPDRPLITFYDDATGERTELSAAALGGWAGRTANLLVDGCGLAYGGRAAVLLPPHWQTAAVLLGAWTAGVSVNFHSAATAGLPPVGPDAGVPYDAIFATAARLRSMIEVVPPAEHRFVLGGAHDGYLDYLAEARRYPETFRPTAPPRRDDPASGDGTTFAEWGKLAGVLAEMFGLRPGDRVLVDAAEHEQPVRWLLAPLAAGASIVLCANLDPTRVASRAAAEGVTRTL